jgi:glycosyltransferase involved in cell wall biosynthesis
MSRVRVVWHARRAPRGVFSIERVFESVRAALPRDIEVRLEVSRFTSRGVLRRLLDALRARQRAGEINHVLGDVHYLAWFLPRRGSILTVHDCVSLERTRGARHFLLWLLWYWLPLQRVEHVTAVSEYTRQALAGWVPGTRAPISVIPPPVPPGFGPHPPQPRGERLRLLQVGTSENKNLGRVIEACHGLPVTLDIIGRIDRACEARLRALGIRYENRSELGDAELVEAYRRCDALIFASTYEGFGLPIIEAQAVGRPVITSRACSMPEASGGAACLVDPFDVADIRRGIRRLIDEPDYASTLVRFGHENAARYAPERVAAAYAELYRRVHSLGAFAEACDGQEPERDADGKDTGPLGATPGRRAGARG